MAQERLILSNAQTSDSDGAATFTLGPAELGYVWKGSVQVPNAPSGALFIARVLATDWGQWAGPTNFGPVQMWGGETLTVTATGLTPATNYVLTLFGVYMEEEEAEPIPPTAPLSVVSVETATLLLDQEVMALTDIVTIEVPPLTRRLTVIVNGANLSPTTESGPTIRLIGNESLIYYLKSSITAGGAGPEQPPLFVAIEPALETTFTLFFTDTGGFSGTATVSILTSFTNPFVTNFEDAPLYVVPASPEFQNDRGLALNTTGSPVGTIAGQVAAFLGDGANQTLIAAPTGDQCIYIQQINISQNAASGGVAGERVGFHGAGSSGFARIVLTNDNESQQMTFPGTFKLLPETALQVDVGGGGSVSILATYTLGPDI